MADLNRPGIDATARTMVAVRQSPEMQLSTGDGKSLKVAGLEFVQSALGTEPFSPDAPRPVSKLRGKRIIQEAQDRIRPLFSDPRGDKQTRHSVVKRFGNASDPAGKHRYPSRESLNGDPWGSFVPNGREHQCPSTAEKTCDLSGRDATAKLDLAWTSCGRPVQSAATSLSR